MNCIKCGKEIAGGSTFCPVCGAKQIKVYKEVLVREHLSEREFIDNINKWFQWHPKAANVHMRFETGTAFGLFVNQTRLNRVEIEYELSEKENPCQYGLVREYQVGLIPGDMKRYIARWQQKHPQSKVMSWAGGSNARGSTSSMILGGIGAVNKMTMFLLIQFRRSEAQPQQA